MTVYEIDGANLSTLEEFYDEIGRVLVPGVTWGRNLDAFNDILHGGFGTPEDGFLLRWTNHELSRARLGPTRFDELREIIDGHPTGFPPRGRVELVLA